MNNTQLAPGGPSVDATEAMNATKLELSLSDVTIGIVSVLIVLPLAAVALRLYVRGYIVKRFDMSDLFIALAAVFAVVNTITLIYHCKDSMTSTDIMVTATWVFYLTYWPAIWSVQMSICGTCWRIFHVLGSHHAKVLIWTIMGMISAYTIAGFTATLFSCTPLSSFWNANTTDHCIELPAFKIATAVITACFDGIILLLACLVAYRTELNLRNKVWLVGILKVGFIAFLASIGRMIAQVLIENSTSKTPHHTYIWILLPIFSAVQVDLGITAACLPALAPLLKSNRRAHRARRPSDSYLKPPLPVSTAARHVSTPGCMKTDMQYKSIVVEREYSVKTEPSPAQSRRNSFTRSHVVMDLEKGRLEVPDSDKLVQVSSLEITELPRDATSQAQPSGKTTPRVSQDKTRGQIEEHDLVESKIRAARLLGLKEEENKYLSVLNPKRWSRIISSKRNSIAPSDDLKIEEA